LHALRCCSLLLATGSGPLQQPITNFVSSGGGGSGAQQLDAFYRRLASTPEQQLPSSIGRVQLTLALPPVASTSNTSSAGTAVTSDLLQSVTSGVTLSDAVEAVREEWLVCNQLGGGDARALALKAWRDEKVKMVPWVGVAARLTSSSSSISGEGLLADDGAAGLGRSDAAGALAGRAFCFLPLPAATGLPAHINGYFELSSNRRDVWHGSDMAGAGRLRAQVRWTRYQVHLSHWLFAVTAQSGSSCCC
jgi:sacsin